MTKNLTVGNPALLILNFAVPLIIGNLFQQFYNMADSIIVGRTIGMNALAAVGCTGSLTFLIVGFMMGFTQGASILTSQRFGADDQRGIRRSFAATIILGLCVTVVLMAVSIAAARPLLHLLRTPENIFEDAYSYLRVIFWGMPTLLLFNVCSNTMRAVGDSRTPLIFLVVACLINVVLDYVFILVFHTGVEGAAYATVIAQFLSGLACIPVIMKKLPILRITKDDWKHVGVYEVIAHLKLALPVGFQMSIIAIGAVTVTFALNTLGTTAVAAFTAGQKIDMLATMPLQSFGSAMTTYAAQNFGARKLDRIKQGVIQCAIMSGGFSLVMGVVFFFNGQQLAGIFLNGENEAVAMTHTYLKINGSLYLILSLLFNFRQTLQGLGSSVIPTLAGIMELVMRTFAAIILSAMFGFSGICFASPLAWIGAMLPLTIALVVTLKKLKYPSKQ
jgi:putative MATE family efflux protein